MREKAILLLFWQTLFAASTLASTGGALGGEGTIQVRSVVEVEGGSAELTLNDVMVAHGVSRAALDVLNQVRIADTPKPGESRSFTANGIEQVFRPHLQDIEAQLGERITLRVPTRVTISRKSFRLGPEEVEAALRAQFKELCADCTFEISGLMLPIIPTTVSSGSAWHVQRKGDIPKGSFSLPLEVSNDDGSRRNYWISGQVAIRKQVPVASRSIEIGERLRAEDFSTQEKDVTFATDVAPTPSELAASLVARQISAGQIVWRSSLRREMALKYGDIVKVSAGEDGWQVMIDGVSQSSGYIGDTVKVKIPRTQKMISGLLTEKGVVEVR